MEQHDNFSSRLWLHPIVVFLALLLIWPVEVSNAATQFSRALPLNHLRTLHIPELEKSGWHLWQPLWATIILMARARWPVFSGISQRPIQPE